MPTRTSIALAALLTCLGPAAYAQAPCPAGNLLANRAPTQWQDVRGSLAVATDGVAAPEGAVWDAPLATVLDTGAATVTWDLGSVVELRAGWVQADANDAYTLWGSLDGTTFRELARVDSVVAQQGHGLRGRKLSLGGVRARFVRFGEGVGDGSYSLAELQVFCEVPTPFPPPMRVGEAASARSAWRWSAFWNDETSARWELVLALLALALLAGGAHLAAHGRPHDHAKARDRLLAALGALAALSYVNFGAFHFGNFIHNHEWTHYYVGSKYFDELAYERLYECLSLADLEDGLRRRVELRKITNLRTNEVERTDDLLAHPERCRAHFSDARWNELKHDVRFFRERMSPKAWDDLQLDHGYNATPVWNALGSTLANLAPASAAQINLLALLDPAYLVATIAVIWWAFGWRVLSVALLVFATCFPARFYWTGGAFLRWDWLFYLVAAVACLRRRRPALAGAALAYAALLRVFPVIAFAGPAFAVGWQLVGTRTVDPLWRRFFAGAAVATALLVPLSLAASGGSDAYVAFARNTRKHQETALTNAMGLRTVLSARPATSGRALRDERLLDPWKPWKQARHETYGRTRPLHVLGLVAALVMLALAARHTSAWAITALAITVVPIAVELTSYYFAFVLPVALLAADRERIGRWLLALTAFTQLVAWAPLPGMARGFDEQHVLMSVGFVAVFAVMLWEYREREAQVARGPSEQTG